MRDYKIEGMHCASCASAIEKSVRKIEGIQKASVNLATHKLTVDARADENAVKEAVERAGYRIAEDPDSNVLEEHGSARKMWIAWILTLPIAIAMIVHMTAMDALSMRAMNILNASYILFSIPVLFWIGKDVFASAARSIRSLSFNMDSLIALGTLAAFITGPLSYVISIENYAAIGAMIMAFHLTGRHIEARARGKSSQAIKALLTLEAKDAIKIVDGEQVSVPIAHVAVDDVVLVKSGEKVPVDGVVIEGESSIDESMMSGESMPVDKFVGSKVIGGTLNQDGVIHVRVEKVGKDAFLSQIIRMVEEAQGSKVPIQEYADKVTGIFVPIVLALAALTFLAWIAFPAQMIAIASSFSFIPWLDLTVEPLSLAIFSSIAVLVIACPCALGLATPTALMVSTGMGAQRGILIRNGEAIQTLKDTRIIVFDKTGTLTHGTPKVTDVITSSSSEEVTRLAASVESKSSHPLARAITEHTQGPLNEVSSFVTLRGKGVRAIVKGSDVIVGNRALIRDEEIDISEHEATLEQLENEGKTVMIVAKDRRIEGLIAVSDTIKEEARETISTLKSNGWRVYLITGDNERAARAIANKAGIEDVLAHVLPDEKASRVEELQKEGLVAFVGDGINDAPALKQANVGIAIGTGTDIAIESADIIIVRGELDGVVRAVNLSRETFKKIQQNLVWAYGYNIIAIPLAVIGVLHPIIAEIAMAASSVSVVANANLLKRRRI